MTHIYDVLVWFSHRMTYAGLVKRVKSHFENCHNGPEETAVQGDCSYILTPRATALFGLINGILLCTQFNIDQFYIHTYINNSHYIVLDHIISNHMSYHAWIIQMSTNCFGRVVNQENVYLYIYIYIYIHPWVFNQNLQCDASIELIVNNISMDLSRGLNIVWWPRVSSLRRGIHRNHMTWKFRWHLCLRPAQCTI